MSHTLRRIVAVLCLATLLGGCVIVPERHGYWGPHHGWGWRHY
jgi:hypothetical protein